MLEMDYHSTHSHNLIKLTSKCCGYCIDGLLCQEKNSHIFVGAVYYPPSAQNGRMLDHLVSTMDTVSREHPYTGCILLGDFNQLPEGPLRSYPPKQIVAGPTRNSATLDKIFTNIANWYHSPVILPAVTKSDHNHSVAH